MSDIDVTIENISEIAVTVDDDKENILIVLQPSGGGSGSGLPVGGTVGQVLGKASGIDYDVEWIDQTGATNLGYVASPTDGTVTSDTGTPATIPATDGINAGLFLPAEKTKLSGIATGATANSSDAFLLDRTNHTGVQAITTVTGLQAALDGKELLVNKSTDTALGNSDTLYPTQNAVKTYVDNSFASLQTDQSGGTSDTYGTITGLIDGINDTFTVSAGVYTTGLLQVYLNGKLSIQGTAEGWVELNPAAGTFQFNTPPFIGDEITAVYFTAGVGSGGGGGATNLSYAASPTSGLVVSDNGTDATIPAADATNAGLLLPAEKTKLTNIAPNATANSTDAFLLDRTNHTGTQAIATVTGLQTALDGKEPTITLGTTGQYWRGDKSFQTLDKAAVGLANVENTALSTWAGSSNITTVGTLLNLTVTNPINGSITGNAATVTNGALTTGTLAQFAATTSAQLAGVISDETGTGSIVFNTSPAFITPALDTPASGILTNCSGLPQSGVVDLTTDLANKQPLDGDLTAIANLAGTGILQKTAPDTWSFTSSLSDPTTTEGDLIYRNSGGALTRLAIGTENKVLVSNGTIPIYANPLIPQARTLLRQALGSPILTQTLQYEDTTGVSNFVSQRAQYGAFYNSFPVTATGAWIYVATAGVFTGNNNNYLKLYSYSAGTLTEVATTANDENIWKSSGFIQVPFSVSANLTRGAYYLGFLYCNSAQTTAPQARVSNVTIPSFGETNSAAFFLQRNSQTSLPASESMVDLTAGAIQFVGGVY